MQPLDVGFFGPLKGAWKQQLRTFADQDPSRKLLTKPFIPRLLKEVLKGLNGEQTPLFAAKLPNGFERCGLWPLNRQKVLE